MVEEPYEEYDELEDYDEAPVRRTVRPQGRAGSRPRPNVNIDLSGYSNEDIGKFGAELIGTFLLVLFGTGAVLSFPDIGALSAAFGFGFGLMAIIYAIGHISGAHVNPAVTVGLALAGRFPMTLVPGYIISQLIGGILASLLARLVWTNTELHLGANSVTPGVNDFRALVLEIVLTAVLVFVIMGAAVDKRAPLGFAGLGIGATLLVIQLVGAGISGGSVNPARSIGPAVASWSQFGDLWIYIVGPLVGGIVGAMLYQLLSTMTDGDRA